MQAKLYHNQDSQISSEADTEPAESSEHLITKDAAVAQENIHLHDHDHDHDHDHGHNHDHDHGHGHDHDHGHGHDHKHDHCHGSEHSHDNNNEKHSHTDNCSSSETPSLATEKAVEKLQSRFTTLISQVADLTEEKQNLEHLVLQLQGETETIGEYIALYQTQRRMLKQREYEKATQMRLLKAEREQLREKINALNTLVGSLGLELPVDQQSAATDNNIVEQQQQQLTSSKDNQKENGNSQQILHKIQDIITEIKVNTEESPTLSNAAKSDGAVDHLNCCLGKFEVV